MKKRDIFTGKSLTPPKEDFECKLLVSYLKQRSVTFYTHIANESPSVKSRVRNAALGLTKGVPDYFIILPNGKPCFIEMKRRVTTAHRPRISDAQYAWIDRLNEVGVASKACFGFEQAKQFIEELWPVSEQSATQLEFAFADRLRPRRRKHFSELAELEQVAVADLVGTHESEDIS